MPHIDPNNPNSRNGRMASPAKTTNEEMEEFTPIVPTNTPAAPAPAEQQESSSEAVKETAPAKQQKEKKRTSAPAKQGRASKPRKEKMEDIREGQRAVFWLKTEDHRLLKVACVVNGITMTDFLEGVCLDALHHSYRCRNAACNCEFVFRFSSADTDVDLCCPACGNKKLDKVFKL